VPPPDSAAPERDVVLQVQNESDEFETWQRTDDLFAADPDAQVYTLDPEAGEVRFGSGLRGKRPGFGQVIRISYEYGGGPEGNVNIGAINKSAALPGGFKLSNPVPTWGASRGETTAEGEQSISSFLQHRDRLVTAEDFRAITRRTPGVNIGRVEVLPLFNPNEFSEGGDPQSWPGALTVLVVPGHDIEQTTPPVPDRLFLDAICRWLDPRRLVTTEVFVRGPRYIRLAVSIGIVTMPGQVRAIVHRDVQAALREYLSPLLGGPQTSTDDDAAPHGAGWPLGMEVRSRDLEAVAVRVPGVRYVNDVRLGVLDGTTVQPTENRRMEGIQLPWLAAISVREGDPEDVAALVGQTPDETQGTRVHVPVVPRTCY
jgi:predicted phage baseplate assembly protein